MYGKIILNMESEKKKARAIIDLQESYRNEGYVKELEEKKVVLENDYLKNENLLYGLINSFQIYSP